MRNAPFWVRDETPALAFAPMDGVTDHVFRELYTRFGGFDFCVTEFLRVTDHLFPPKVFFETMPELKRGSRTSSGTPVLLQILGGKPGPMAENAKRAIELGAAGVDINFGCPAPTVNRNDGGATILKYPDRVESITRAVRDAVPPEYPVSVKVRLGWECIDDVFENAERAQSGGASWITIHARTRLQLYKPPAYWRNLRRVRESLRIPVFANGDIWTLDDFNRCAEETQCRHFMLGRGALSDPTLARQIQSQIHRKRRDETAPQKPTGAAPSDWAPFLGEFLEFCRSAAIHDEYQTRKIKLWLRFAGMRQALPWFHDIKVMQEARSIEAFVCKPNA